MCSSDLSDATVVEGDAGTRNLVVPITLSDSATADVLVHYSTVPGSAVAGADYTARSGTIKIAKGKRQVTVTVPIASDTVSESTESFSLVVDSAPNATIAKGTGTITVRDDD